MRIYFVLLRFAVIAVLSAIVDNLAFLTLFRLGEHLLLAQIGARVTSLLFNYPAVRSRVFCSDERHWVLLPRYLFLAGINVALSYCGVRLLIATGFTVMWAKLLADGLLFVFSFAVQHGVIFVKRSVLKKTL
jgi:putative flippase GtrA